jgi:hypothetical protein
MTFAALPVHDATLTGVHFDWAKARCIFSVVPVGLDPHRLVFSGVSELHIPRHEPWGPSTSVNGIRENAPGIFEVELQSGDVLRIVASAWEFRHEQTHDAV